MEVRLEWQPMVRFRQGWVQLLDVNGNVMSDARIGNVRWGPPWVLAGVVPLDDSFVAWSGIAAFDACAYGMMRHLAGLLVGGYGDEPEEVVIWFKDMAKLEWLVDGATYCFDRDCPPIEGLIGVTGQIAWQEESAVLYIDAGKRQHEVSLSDVAMQRALLQAAVVDHDSSVVD